MTAQAVEDRHEATLCKLDTREELKDALKQMKADDPIYRAYKARVKLYNDLQKKHERRITDALNAPYHDEAKRWKHGQKVYFGKGDNRTYMSFSSLRMTKVYDIKPGDWCYVYEYQPRKKIAWLCQPGKPCKYQNVIDHAFSLNDLRHADVSRVELDLR